MFDSSMVNEPSGFEPLKFYLIEQILENTKHDLQHQKIFVGRAYQKVRFLTLQVICVHSVLFK